MFRPGVLMFAAVAAAGAAPPLVDRQAPTTTTSISRDDIERLPTARRIEDLLKTCPARTIPTVNAQSPTVSNGKSALGPNCIQPDDLRMVDIYRAHNFARAQVGSPPLVWDRQLALGANLYAQEMARNRQFVHSTRDNRNLVRENLLSTPRGWSPQQMIGRWIGERQNLVPGTFPNVSRTGNWADVAHYTQMVWPTTTSIGCAIQPGGGFDWLICRYSPPGNRDGVAIGPGGVVLAKPRPEILCVDHAGGMMMCPESPKGGGKQGAGGPHRKQDEGGGAQGQNDTGQTDEGGQTDEAGGTTVRPPDQPRLAPPTEGIGGGNAHCHVGVFARVLIPTGRTRRDGSPIYKETHNLMSGFTEVVIPDGFEAKGDFRPNADDTRPYSGTMRASWGIVGDPNPYTGTVSGDYAKLARGRWDDHDGTVTINPGPNRPVVQQHEILAHWASPPVDCDLDEPFRFLVTFAGEIPTPAGLDLHDFVEGAKQRGYPGTRPRTPYPTGTRAFHQGPPQPRSRTTARRDANGDVVHDSEGHIVTVTNVVVPIGVYWDLPQNCCNIRNADRRVIQFARAAIHGPNGRMGKGWGLDILPQEVSRAQHGRAFDPTYSGAPRSDGNEEPMPGGAGGTARAPTRNGKDVEQWDAPGMPKDLYDRLFAAQGPSIYRQQFLSLLVCRPHNTDTADANLGSALICQVAITTVRWDFPGQRGVERPRGRRGAPPPPIPYRQPTITVTFDVRDGHCAPLQAFLAANNLLNTFQHPSSEARNLEILQEDDYHQLDSSVSGWESSPFGDVHFP